MPILPSSASIQHCWIVVDIHSTLAINIAAIILHCPHHQPQLQHTNINTKTISSSIGLLTYLSASSIHPSIFHSPPTMHSGKLVCQAWSPFPCAASHLTEWWTTREEWRSGVRLEDAICRSDGVWRCIIALLLLDRCALLMSPAQVSAFSATLYPWVDGCDRVDAPSWTHLPNNKCYRVRNYNYGAYVSKRVC